MGVGGSSCRAGSTVTHSASVQRARQRWPHPPVPLSPIPPRAAGSPRSGCRASVVRSEVGLAVGPLDGLLDLATRLHQDLPGQLLGAVLVRGAVDAVLAWVDVRVFD